MPLSVYVYVWNVFDICNLCWNTTTCANALLKVNASAVDVTPSVSGCNVHIVLLYYVAEKQLIVCDKNLCLLCSSSICKSHMPFLEKPHSARKK